jgi:probable rRNA maturation factor
MSAKRTARSAKTDAVVPPVPPRSLAVDVVREAGDWSPFGDAIEAAIQVAASAVARVEAAGVVGAMEAVVALADDATVKRLNSQFRGQAKPTNVLSFPSGTPKSAALGDVVFALETVRAEAAELEISPMHHVQHLTVHGLLHLLGFDHVETAGAEIMERLEIEILASIGIPDPYAGRDLVRGA